MARCIFLGLIGVLLAMRPALAKDEPAIAGVYQSTAHADGATEEWTITGEPTFWKIEISFRDKDGKEIGHGYVATATRRGKDHELNFVLQWKQKPDSSWPDFPHGQVVFDPADKNTATFKFQSRGKDLLSGELHRVTK